jgi:FkbM family methyltransferase
MDSIRRVLPGPVKILIRPIHGLAMKTGTLLIKLALCPLKLVLGKNLFIALCHGFAREIDYTVTVDGIIFDAEQPRPFERARELLTKEPDTINWIRDFMGKDDVMYDVGANIGVFGLYAAAKQGTRVLAFEPMCTNYDILNKNIHLNGLDERMTAYNIAFYDKTAASHLNMSRFRAGQASHGYHRAIAADHETEFEPAFRQGMIGFSLDDFIEKLDQPCPNHIKIDVDGSEPQIIRGMTKTLADPQLKTIAIELDPDHRPADQEVLEIIKANGFELLDDEAYINRAYISWTAVHNCFLVRRDAAKS